MRCRFANAQFSSNQAHGLSVHAANDTPNQDTITAAFAQLGLDLPFVDYDVVNIERLVQNVTERIADVGNIVRGQASKMMNF